MANGCPLWFRISFLAVEGSFDDIFDQGRLAVFLLFDGDTAFGNVDLEGSVDGYNYLYLRILT